MARICIVTPGALGSNPRVVKEADALVRAGHDVHVIATRSLAVVDARDAAILAHAAWTCERIDLRTPANRIRRKLGEAAARLVNRLTGWAAAEAMSPLTALLQARALAHPADLYIAHYDPALPAAARAARRWGGRYAFDAEDFHPGDLADTPENRRQNALIRAVESRWLPGCAYVTASSPGIAEAYAGAYSLARPTVVLNVFSRGRAAPASTGAGTVEPGPSLYWFSQTVGPDRGLENALRAIALSRSKPHLHLRGSLAGGYREAMDSLARALGVSDRLHFHEPASPLDMERLAAAHDLGLAAETGETTNHQMALANKLFTYLLAGVPVLLSDIPGHRAFAELAPGAAFVFQAASPEALADHLDDLLGDPARLAAARAQAFRLGQDRFNWETEEAAFMACVDTALMPRGAGHA